MRELGVFSGLALISVTVWGASFVATRVALEALLPTALVSARLAMGSLLLALLMRQRGMRVLPERGQRGIVLGLGALLGLHLLIQAIGLQYTSATRTGWIIGFIPVTIALGAAVFLRQKLAAIGWAGVAVATMGVLLITLRRPEELLHARWGDLLQVVSCLTWTAYTLISARPVARYGALPMTTAPMAVAAVLLLAATPLTGGALREGQASALTMQSAAAVAFLGIMCSGVAFACWFRAVEVHGATRTGSYIYLEPVVTMLVARVWTREPVTALAVVGGMTILLGVYLVARGTTRIVRGEGGKDAPNTDAAPEES